MAGEECYVGYVTGFTLATNANTVRQLSILLRPTHRATRSAFFPFVTALRHSNQRRNCGIVKVAGSQPFKATPGTSFSSRGNSASRTVPCPHSLSISSSILLHRLRMCSS